MTVALWTGARSVPPFRLLLISLFVLCYLPVLAMLSRQYFSNDVYSYAFAVPVISAYIAYTRLRQAAPVQQGADYVLGIPTMAAGLAMLVVGHLGSIAALQALSLVVSVAGMVLMLFGRDVFRVVWFPVAYLLFMVPVWDGLLGQLHAANQLLSAKIGTGLLHLLGVPAFRQGVTIALPAVVLEVARECSGVNQLIAVAAIGLPAAYLMLKGIVARVALIAFALFIAALSNGVRIALIGVLSFRGWDGGNIHGPYHILQGLAVSVAGYVVIFAALSFLAKRGKGRRERIVPHATPPSRWTVRRRPVEIALAAALVITGGYRLFFSPSEVLLNESLEKLPAQIAEWTIDPTAPPATTMRVGGADDELVRVYRSATGGRMGLYIAYHRHQGQGKELVGESGGSLGGSRSGTTLQLDAGRTFAVNRQIVEEPGRRSELIFWYDLNGRAVANPYAAKLYTIWDAATRARTNGAIIALAWESDPAAQSEGSQQSRAAFVRALLPLLRQHIPS